MFGIFKKKKVNAVTQNVNSFGEPLDKLVDGELPWGWLYANKAFVDKIQNEHRYFRFCWADTRNKNPREQYAALKSFIMYMEDVQKLCREKGECFEFWCNEILQGSEYKECKEKLAYIEDNMDALNQEYEEKKKHDTFARELTDEKLLEDLAKHEGILQTDFCKLYPYPTVIKNRLYCLSKEGKIERIKSGNTYILNTKKD